MKYAGILLAFALMLSLAYALPAPSADDLVVNLHLENNGTDATNHHNDADLFNDMQFVPNCVVGGCYYWGAYAYGQINDSVSIRGERNFTLSFWVNSTAVYRALVIKVYGVQGWGAGILTGDTYLIRASINGGDLDAAVPDYADGLFHHVVVTYDHDLLKIYWDSSLNSSTGSFYALVNNTLPIMLGVSEDFYPDSFFNGEMDEIHLWNRALSGTEVNELYNYEKAGNTYPAPAPIPGPGTTIAGLPNYAAIGYPYFFNVTTGINITTSCTLKAYDRFNMLTKAWFIDASGFPMRTNRNGTINDFVKIDDAFQSGGYYNFTMQCGLYETPLVEVYIDTPGTSEVSLFAFNFIGWVSDQPMNAIAVIAGILFALLFAIYLYGRFMQ